MENSKLKPYWDLLPAQIPEGAEIARITNFQTASGRRLSEICLPFCSYGRPNSQGTNTIVIVHALSSSCLVASRAGVAGWWDGMVGPGCPIDTSRYHVVCIANLCSPYGATSPVNPPRDDQHDGFPPLSFGDIVSSQRRVLAELGITRPFAVIGPSMGGMIALEWALRHSANMERLILVCSTWRPYAMNVANRAAQREALLSAESGSLRGMILARMMGLISYTSESRLARPGRLAGAAQHDVVAQRLLAKARHFADHYPAACYHAFLDMMDAFDAEPLFAAASRSAEPPLRRTLVLSASSDHLFGVDQQTDMAARLEAIRWPADHKIIHTANGHDSFLIDHGAFGREIENFLNQDLGN